MPDVDETCSPAVRYFLTQSLEYVGRAYVAAMFWLETRF